MSVKLEWRWCDMWEKISFNELIEKLKEGFEGNPIDYDSHEEWEKNKPDLNEPIFEIQDWGGDICDTQEGKWCTIVAWYQTQTLKDNIARKKSLKG